MAALGRMDVRPGESGGFGCIPTRLRANSGRPIQVEIHYWAGDAYSRGWGWNVINLCKRAYY